MPREELGYRKGPVPANDLELFWLPADRRWNAPIASAAIELLINPRQSITAPNSVIWWDGSSDEVPRPPTSRTAPRLRHVYAHRADVTVQVQLVMLIANLPVALVGCPVSWTAYQGLCIFCRTVRRCADNIIEQNKNIMQVRIVTYRRPRWALLAKPGLGAAVAVGVLTAGPAQALAVKVNVDGQDWVVTTFTGSYNKNKPKFAVPSSPGGVMPWWGSEILASQFASAVGHSLGTQVFAGIAPENIGKIGSFFGYDASIDGTRLYFDYSFALKDGTFEVRQNSGVNRGIENTKWAQGTLAAAPGPMPALGAAAAFGLSRKLRSRIKKSGKSASSIYTL